jgi:hypothetical protein
LTGTTSSSSSGKLSSLDSSFDCFLAGTYGGGGDFGLQGLKSLVRGVFSATK